MKRQLMCVLVAVAVVFSVLAVYTAADSTVTVPTVVFQPGEIVENNGVKTVSVTVSIQNNPGFVTATIPVKWDPAHLELVAVEENAEYFGNCPDKVYKTDTWSDGWLGMTLADSHNAAGLYNLAWGYDASFQNNKFNFTDDDVLATLTFKVIAAADTGSTIVTAKTSDIANFMDWDMKEHWGEFEFVDGEILLKEDIIGDVNGDGSVNGNDIQRIYVHITGTAPITDAKMLEWADVNKDSVINGNDIQRIYTHITGASPLF